MTFHRDPTLISSASEASILFGMNLLFHYPLGHQPREATLLKVGFWSCASLIVYAYLLYPLIVGFLAKVWGRPPRRDGGFPRSVSVVLAAYNEAASIGRRIEGFMGLLATAPISNGEIIVVSDGSTDGTAQVARTCARGSARVIDLPANVGKAAALTKGCAAARSDIIVLADARQSWGPDALKYLLENFSDPSVGAVSGDLVIESSPGVLAGVGLYWRYEKWLRRQESDFHSTVGVSGAISAVRRGLFRPIPPGTILDDVYWPLQVVMQGFRVVHDRRAQAFDQLPGRTRDEFHRKIRTLSGNFQLVMRLPAALVPWHNPVWFQFISHKLLRLLVPWALLGLLGLSALLHGAIYRIAFCCQIAFYLIALLGTWKGIGSRFRLGSAAASFLVLNTAAWLAFWVWIAGRSSRSWRKVSYAAGIQQLEGHRPQNPIEGRKV